MLFLLTLDYKFINPLLIYFLRLFLVYSHSSQFPAGAMQRPSSTGICVCVCILCILIHNFFSLSPPPLSLSLSLSLHSEFEEQYWTELKRRKMAQNKLNVKSIILIAI